MGLAAREIERRGTATAVLSWMPEITQSVGAPRVVGIGYPGSTPIGRPHDDPGQRAVLRSALEAAAAIETPGARVDLDFEWPASERVPKPPQPPPIARLIMKRPWNYLRLLKGELPGRADPLSDSP